MTRVLAADTCPSCQGVHEVNGGQPGDWPVCPVHGHWLYVLRGPLPTKTSPGGGWTYACQAPGCTHTHTQKEKATMTTTPEAALAIRRGQDFWDAKQIAALNQLGIQGATNADLAVFFHYCQKTGLDPFARQIYMIGRKMKDGTVRQTIQTGIDGYRLIARRAADAAGVDLSYGPPVWYDGDGREYKVWVYPHAPAAASVTVYRGNKPFPGVARFASFCPVGRDGQPMGLWATMPDHQIAKCAEAQALRKAFPNDLEGLSTDTETAHYGNRPPAAPIVTAASELPPPEPRSPRARPRRPRPETNTEALRAQIGRHFDRLGLDDHEERAVYVNRLNNKPADAPFTGLTDRELKVALDVLAGKEDGEYVVTDLAALVELCNPDAS